LLEQVPHVFADVAIVADLFAAHVGVALQVRARVALLLEFAGGDDAVADAGGGFAVTVSPWPCVESR
jgi:poly(3-hydroxybutyrate) depolymerase